VIVEPKTGKIRAIVSKPSFDPNVMTGHLTHAEYTLLLNDPLKPFVDKSLRRDVPARIDLQVHHGVCRARRRPSRRGRIDVLHRRVSARGHAVPLSRHARQGRPIARDRALVRRVFLEARRADRLDRIAEVAREYGLGAPTNLGLNGDSGGDPDEGLVRKKSHYKIGYAANAAIGQGDVEVTVLQMAMAYAAIANGGTLFVPQVVERRRSQRRPHDRQLRAKVAHTIKTPVDALDTWKRGMWKVTNELGGTAYEHGHIEASP